ncbi:serine/threonine protein kinase [Streptomyces sp. SPB074]|uniref:serine/threonine protein kinase n=1 Tax=Streptomyces sp. (strain SPB074) TaxID=465543 RepID=UPI00017F0E39|nr:serine/threonine protein kinase [Streptomyces sp. SPB074]
MRTTRQQRRRSRALNRSARLAVKALNLPRGAGLEDATVRVALHIGWPLVLLPAEELPLNGALTRATDGTLAVPVPVPSAFPLQPDAYLVHLACRGLARALHNVPGDPGGRIDYRTEPERLVELTATELSVRLRPASTDVHGL